MRYARWAACACCLAAALAAASGCGVGSSVHPADPTQAQAVLRTVLDAWKAGETPDALQKRTPPIHVADMDWRDGFRLVGYQADSEGKLVGYDMNYPVVLELKNPKGTAVKKKAVYTITTAPEVLVLRQEG
jgi:hypothetical protein